MKKITAILVAVVLLLNMMAVMTSAADAKPVDITNDIKWVTAYEMYENKLPVVRADAVFIPSTEYEAAVAPGSGNRTITFTDWAEKGMENYFDDYFNLGDGYFWYDSVWANSSSDPYDHGRLSYTFTVEESGTYELVIVGCGQIKAENVDNDEKDRGFVFQIDGGELQQVNISDTAGTFRDYSYSYSKADLEAGLISTTNGVNSQHYQVVYYYGMQMHLSAGTHTLDYYHLYYSGDYVFESGNGPRLNYMGAYVQKYLTGVEWESYVYPETTAPETTVAPEPETTKEPETEAPDQTTEEATEATNAPEPEKTDAPTPTQTEAPKAEGGCGAMVGFGTLLALIPAALVIKKKRD